MEYGIFFKRPKTQKRGSHLADIYINIEVHTWSEKNQSSDDPEEILLKLNHYWNNSEKLFKLQEHGVIYHLGKNFTESDTEYKRFKGNAKVKEIINQETGDITYVRKSKEDYMDVYLENLVFMSEEENIERDAFEQDWSYVFIFDEINKKFTYRKIDE
jgi:hypothetical protein